MQRINRNEHPPFSIVNLQISPSKHTCATHEKSRNLTQLSLISGRVFYPARFTLHNAGRERGREGGTDGGTWYFWNRRAYVMNVCAACRGAKLIQVHSSSFLSLFPLLSFASSPLPRFEPLSRFVLPHNKEAVARVDLQRLPVLGSAW